MDKITKPLDLTGFEFAQHPFHYYDELRKTGNVHYLEATNSWLIIGYHEIVSILSNYQLFSSEGDHPFDPIDNTIVLGSDHMMTIIIDKCKSTGRTTKIAGVIKI